MQIDLYITFRTWEFQSPLCKVLSVLSVLNMDGCALPEVHRPRWEIGSYVEVKETPFWLAFQLKIAHVYRADVVGPRLSASKILRNPTR